jgi:Ti-type conjugative transfer relaxase TraA
MGADGMAKPHAHVMLTMREVGEDGFGAKVRDWNRTEMVEHWRERWADHVNQRLAELDIDARIDHRSLAEQGIDLVAQTQVGAPAHRMDREGLEPDRIELHREIARANGDWIIAHPEIALDAITKQQATFTNRDLAMFVHRYSDGKEHFDQVLSAVRTSPDLIALGKDGRGEDRFTSRDMIDTEQRLSQASELMAERERHRVDEKDRTTALARAEGRGLVLSGEQRDAFDHLTKPQDLSVVVGYAGTGKSAMLGVAKQAWEGAGFEVRGLALSGIAAENLEQGSGIASRTIASMEHGWAQGREPLTSRDVLVIDEAGMIGTRQMERMLSRAAEAGAKVVLVGDPQQLQAIEAGAAFRSIAERMGSVEITDIRRQREDWQRDATRHLATGRTGEALAAYREQGMVHVADTREAARENLIDRWDRERIAAPADTRIILTHTNDEVKALNEAARDRLRVHGELGSDIHLKIERGGRNFAENDRVMFLKNERGLGVKNGTLGTVEQVSDTSIAMRLDDGRRVGFDLKDYSSFDHGYAATIHKAQGMTVDRAHVLATPGMDSHSAYVGLSRHRDGVQVHYGKDDFADAGKLARTLSRERGKDMAGDYKPERLFAEQRGITFRERVSEVVKQIVPEKVRGMFDGFRLKEQVPERAAGMFANFRPQSHRPEGEQQTRAPDLRRAVERYARAAVDIGRMKGRGLPVLPHQREALEKARAGLDAIRPHAASDLVSAFKRQPGLLQEAAGGRTQAAMQAMQLEAEIRGDPFQRADRFVEGWQQLKHHREELQRDGDSKGERKVGEQMAVMAKSLERDPQMESVLREHAHKLDLSLPPVWERGSSISHDLVQSLGLGRGRSLGMSR